MKVHVVRCNELSSELVQLWSQWQEADPELASPYLRPEFIQAVADVRNDVYVGVIQQNGAPVAFFPFQRSRFGFGRPVGAKVSDFHGLIAAPTSDLGSWDPHDFLSACGLISWEFHHLLASQSMFGRYHTRTSPSHFIDLAHGFEGYAADLHDAGSGLLRDVRAKRRKLERELGPVRIEAHVQEAGVLRTLLRWKSEQYQRGGLTDVFSLRWARELVERIHKTQSEAFAGMLSTLYAGDHLVAGHFGMRSRTVLNWWFPRHDERFRRFSPGILLRIGMAEIAPAMGIRRIDLGLGGDTTYKPRLATGHIDLAEGRIELPSFATAVRRCRLQTESWVRNSRFRGIARIPGRMVTQVEDWLRMR